MELIGGLLSLALAASDLVTLWLAYLLVSALGKRRAVSMGLNADVAADAVFTLALGALVGARLLFLVPALPIYLRNPLDIVRIGGGLSYPGAMAGVVVAALWLAYRRQVPLGRLGDALAPPLAFGVAAYDAGCLLRGNCFGASAPPPFGLVFPGLTQPRYPAELYEAALALAIGWLLASRSGRGAFAGELALFLGIGYPIGRAVVDLFRIAVGGRPTPDQLASLVVAGVAAAVWVWWRRAALRARGEPRDPDAGGGPEFGDVVGRGVVIPAAEGWR